MELAFNNSLGCKNLGARFIFYINDQGF